MAAFRLLFLKSLMVFRGTSLVFGASLRRKLTEFANRADGFPYPKLPLEIRLKICELLLAPLYEIDTDTGKMVIHMVLEEDDSDDPHPMRIEPYLITWAPTVVGNGLNLGESALRMVRDLAHTSKRLRDDIGLAFWARTYIDCSSLYCLSTLHDFLNDRQAYQAVVCGIKGLKLELQATDEDWEEDRLVLQQYRELAKMVQLDRLEIHLHVSDRIFRMIAQGQSWGAWEFQAIRKFEVAKVFVLTATVFAGDSTRFSDDEEEFDYTERLQGKLLPVVRHQLMPKTLDGRE